MNYVCSVASALTFPSENIRQAAYLTGDGVNTDVIGRAAFPPPAERHEHAPRPVALRGNAAVSLRYRASWLNRAPVALCFLHSLSHLCDSTSCRGKLANMLHIWNTWVKQDLHLWLAGSHCTNRFYFSFIMVRVLRIRAPALYNF